MPICDLHFCAIAVGLGVDAARQTHDRRDGFHITIITAKRSEQALHHTTDFLLVFFVQQQRLIE